MTKAYFEPVRAAMLRDFNCYLQHMHECALLRDADSASPTYGKCTCGLDALVTRLTVGTAPDVPLTSKERTPVAWLITYGVDRDVFLNERTARLLAREWAENGFENVTCVPLFADSPVETKAPPECQFPGCHGEHDTDSIHCAATCFVQGETKRCEREPNHGGEHIVQRRNTTAFRWYSPEKTAADVPLSSNQYASVLDTFWREVIKAWGDSENMADNEGLMVTIGRPVIDAARRAHEVSRDPDCICYGNWRAIVNKYEPLIGTRFRDQQGRVFRFFGIVLTDEDYYYGMRSETGGIRLLTCVGYLDERGHGFTPIDGPRPDGESSLTYSSEKFSGAAVETTPARDAEHPPSSNQKLLTIINMCNERSSDPAISGQARADYAEIAALAIAAIKSI